MFFPASRIHKKLFVKHDLVGFAMICFTCLHFLTALLSITLGTHIFNLPGTEKDFSLVLFQNCGKYYFSLFIQIYVE